MSKLYTEDSFHQKLFNYFSNEHNLILLESEMDEIIRIVKSNYIELPSDEEIEKASTDKINILNDCFGQYDFTSGQKDGFIEGAYWMREQILSKNK